ncbi:MAG: hypothetical protein ACRCTZ_09465 [Sarcina sp.]
MVSKKSIYLHRITINALFMVQTTIIKTEESSSKIKKTVPMVNKTVKNNEMFGKFPNKLRDAIISDSELTVLSKFVFLLIAYEKKTKGDNFSPNFNHMLKNYGISKPNYSEALKQLSALGFIKKEVIEYRNNGRLNITIPDEILNKSWSYIPSSIICTDVYTNNQKIMIVLLISLFFNVKNQEYGVKSATALEISNKFKNIGFQERFIFKTLKELSDPNMGYIPILHKYGFYYGINFSALSVIGDRVIDIMKSGKDFKYKKPKPHDFFFLQSEMKIVQNPKNIFGSDEYYEQYFGKPMSYDESLALFKEENEIEDKRNKTIIENGL